MASKYIYSKIIYNNYLNKSKEIKASSLYELNRKCQEQIEIWNRQATNKQAREMVEDLKAQAEEQNSEALDLLNEYKSILMEAICRTEKSFDWSSYIRDDEYEPFEFSKEEPNMYTISTQYKVPKPNIFENIFKSIKNKRETIEKQANQEYKRLLNEYESDKVKSYKKWEQAKKLFEEEKETHNKDVAIWKEEFEKGSSDAIESYFEDVLEESKYPESFPKNNSVQYDPIGKILIVSVQLPSTDDISKIKGYKYVASTKSIKSIEMSEKDYNGFYDNIIKEITLRSIYEIFSEDYLNHISSVVFNGWINSINKANGQEFTACIISVQVSKDKFNQINLEKVSPKECIKDLKGVYAGNLANLAPIKPILEIDRNDSRFITSKEIIDSLDSGDNLATMNWEDFEHLVRELFSKYFSEAGSEVKVTQSSRDGGVDAIAFDPDPIRGGKFVIQAKRYNRIVPVSAVRDLYGTMINEGASKGILVTTSYYGNDSREFVKDKPISLIDGSNLIHMLEEYGYNAHITLRSKKE